MCKTVVIMFFVALVGETSTGFQAWAQPGDVRSLTSLAEERFPGRLSLRERALLKTAAHGERVSAAGEIRAEMIQWLCTDEEAAHRVAASRGLAVSGARIVGALILRDTRIPFPIHLTNCTGPDSLDLSRSSIPLLDLDSSRIGSGGLALNAEGLRVDSDLSLQFSEVTGELRLVGANIGGNLDCDRGRFLNPVGDAINADLIDVKGNVHLRGSGFRAHGTVRFGDARIRGEFNCGTADLEAGKSGVALYCGGAVVEGSVLLRHFIQMKGSVDFAAARIGQTLEIREVTAPLNYTLDLTGTQVQTLWDEQASWPRRLKLDGCMYSHLHKTPDIGVAVRRRWLSLQDDKAYFPQPYERLATVLKGMGHDDEASGIRMAMNEDPVRLKRMSPLQRIGHWLLWLTTGYGYHPWNSLLCMLAFVVVGWVWFYRAEGRGNMQKTGAEVPTFNALMYSIDAHFPIVDLDQRQHRRPTSRLTRTYWWIHTVFGWILGTLFAVGLSGLVRR